MNEANKTQPTEAPKEGSKPPRKTTRKTKDITAKYSEQALALSDKVEQKLNELHAQAEKKETPAQPSTETDTQTKKTRKRRIKKDTEPATAPEDKEKQIAPKAPRRKPRKNSKTVQPEDSEDELIDIDTFGAVQPEESQEIISTVNLVEKNPSLPVTEPAPKAKPKRSAKKVTPKSETTSEVKPEHITVQVESKPLLEPSSPSSSSSSSSSPAPLCAISETVSAEPQDQLVSPTFRIDCSFRLMV